MIEMLGFRSNDRVLIINADDFGISHATNQGIFNLFKTNSITSASIMMPCSAANEASTMCSQNIGIHLTLTSSENYLYKPIFQNHSLNTLVTKEGYFHSDATTLEQNANFEEVRLELQAQIKQALTMGIDLTHLDSHAGTIMGLSTGRDFLEIVFDLCEKYELPFNLPRRILEQPFFSDDQKELFKKRIDSADRRAFSCLFNKNHFKVAPALSCPSIRKPTTKFNRAIQKGNHNPVISCAIMKTPCLQREGKGFDAYPSMNWMLCSRRFNIAAA